MKILLSLFIFLCSFLQTNAGNTSFFISVFRDSTFIMNIGEIKEILKTNPESFISIDKLQSHLNINSVYWVYLQPIKNNGVYVLTLNERLSKVEVYPYPYLEVSGRTGLMGPSHLKALAGGKVIIDGKSKEYLIKIENLLHAPLKPGNFKIETLEVFQKNKEIKDIHQGIVQGFFMLILIYNLFLYFLARKKMHLYYVIYILLNSLFLLFTFGYSEVYLFPVRYQFNLALLSFQLIGVFFYAMFIRKVFLNHCKTYTELIDRYLLLPYSFIFLLTNASIGIVAFYRQDIFIIASNTSNVLSTLFGFFLFAYFYKKSDSFLRLIMFGSAILFLFGYLNVAHMVIYKHSDVFYETGLLVELVVLTYALNKQYFKEQYEIENEKLRLEIELKTKNRELVFQAMQLSAKDEAIASIKEFVKKTGNNEYSNSDLFADKANKNLWNEFEKHFTEINPGFYKSLIEKYPSLTQSEIRLCSFLKLNLNTKEIALITQKSPHSIETMRFRVRQKMGIPRGANFSYILTNL